MEIEYVEQYRAKTIIDPLPHYYYLLQLTLWQDRRLWGFVDVGQAL